MTTQILTGEDTRFLAQQPEYEVTTMVGQMTTLMQNITALQSDTDDKVAQIENQGWFKRMSNTLFGRSKATRREIQKNNDKVVTYISQSVAQLYNMNLINEKVISSLGNRMNEVYMVATSTYQEQLNMKGQISQLASVQQQTIEALGTLRQETMEVLGAFVNKLNEKIESVDNFHMLISEIEHGIYNDSSKLYNLCSILAQLDKRQMEDQGKMKLLQKVMTDAKIITFDDITVLRTLQEIVALPQEKIGVIYLELCNFRSSFPANLFADMIESYHFLSKMEKMSKKKVVIIQHVLDKYELEPDAIFSISDISESFFENKQASLIEIGSIPQIGMDNSSATAYNSYQNDGNITNDVIEENVGKFYEVEGKVDYQAVYNYLVPLAKQGFAAVQNELSAFYEFGLGNCEMDSNKELELLTKSAEQGYAEGQNGLGRLYQHGGYDGVVPVDERKAEYWLGKAAEQGDADHQYDYALLLKNLGKERECFKWAKKSAEQDCAEGQNLLGLCYGNGIGVGEDDYEAFEWYEKAANNGFDMGMYNLADRYYYGEGTRKDYKRAVQWYEACLNSPLIDEDTKKEIYENLGDIYFDGGKGIRQDYQKAYNYYHKSADLGSASAMNMIGRMYNNGYYVTKSTSKANEWYKKAIKEGNTYAKYNYAMNLINNGNFEKALDLLVEAADEGVEAAQEFLDENGISY